MICGSATPPFYYGFMCDETRVWGHLYLLLIWLFCFAATLLTVFNTDRTKKMLNTIAFTAAGFSGAPGIVQLAYFTDDLIVRSFALWPWAIGGVFYGVGALLYALYIPERLFPESRFISAWLHSHTLFHWCVIVAAGLHFWASLRIFHERQIFPCPEAGVFETQIGHFATTNYDL